jgi:mannose-6-phosphate isomerase-like protein (cupin superfamily)
MFTDETLKQIELQDTQRNEALHACKEVLNSWNLTLPDVEPSPLHFGLNEFYNFGHIEFIIVNNMEEGYCGKFIFMFRGQTCPCHHHIKKHETFFIVKGKIEMEIENKKIIMNQGDCLSVPQNVKHKFTAIEGDALLLESSKPDLVNDSVFVDDRINKIIPGP